MDGLDDGDQFDNLRINSWEDDTSLEQYVSDLDKNLNDNIQYEKEQFNQKLFQSFQNSACGVAQMFKDKTQPSTPWNSFQNAAGAITVMYKDSLDACKGHYDLGVSIGQQRKVKELVNWLRKKKRRVIRKDELITFLIGTNPNMKTNMASNGSMTQSTNRRQQQQENTSLTQITSTNSATHRRQSQLDTIINGANSDLATFREALIMHNRTRDNTPIMHHHHHHNNNNTTTTTTANTNNHHHQQNPFFMQQQQQQNANHTCDDLDCFFCEQIATHIEHKRSASNMDIDSPTRKRGRFY